MVEEPAVATAGPPSDQLLLLSKISDTKFYLEFFDENKCNIEWVCLCFYCMKSSFKMFTVPETLCDIS